MRVAIVGSRRYENKKKIKDFIFKLKQKHGDKTIIVSGGCKHHFMRFIICIVFYQTRDMINHLV